MSIFYCERHDRRWDSDKLEECPLCENEQVEEYASDLYDCPIHGKLGGENYCPRC